MGYDIEQINERDLHDFLTYFVGRNLNVSLKTIDEKKSTTKPGTKGENKWLHPDMVGVSLPFSSFKRELKEFLKASGFRSVKLFSFELKKSLEMSSLREQYFQAVSNSSWANEGYLVAADIDENNDSLMKELSRLSNAFGIGVIRIDLDNVDNSRILLSSKNKGDLDIDTMNKLYEINEDFRVFIEEVKNSIDINKVVRDSFDKIKTLEDLYDSIKGAEVNEEAVLIKEIVEEETESDAEYVRCSLEDQFINTAPKSFVFMDNTEVGVQSWKDLYVKVCRKLYETDKNIFENIQSYPYFSKLKSPKISWDKSRLRSPYEVRDGLFLETNLSADGIRNIIIQLLSLYKIDSASLFVFVDKC